MGKFYCGNSIFERQELTPTEKLAYIYFCRRANRKGESWPAYSTIADDCGFSRRHAVRVVGKLVSVGLIIKTSRRRENGGASSNLYLVLAVGQDVTTPVTSRHPKKDLKDISNIRTGHEQEKHKELIRAMYLS